MKRWAGLLGLCFIGCPSPLVDRQRESLGYVRLAHKTKTPQSAPCIDAALVASQAAYDVLVAREQGRLPLFRTGPSDLRNIADTSYNHMLVQCKEFAAPSMALRTGMLPPEKP